MLGTTPAMVGTTPSPVRMDTDRRLGSDLGRGDVVGDGRQLLPEGVQGVLLPPEGIAALDADRRTG